MQIRTSKDLIKEIRRAQKEAGLTDERIAFFGNLSKATVSQLLSGKSKEFSFRSVLKIAKALECNLDITFRKRSK